MPAMMISIGINISISIGIGISISIHNKTDFLAVGAFGGCCSLI